mgnify:CR=1 FL=1
MKSTIKEQFIFRIRRTFSFLKSSPTIFIELKINLLTS